jgi:hypothetical protein
VADLRPAAHLPKRSVTIRAESGTETDTEPDSDVVGSGVTAGQAPVAGRCTVSIGRSVPSKPAQASFNGQNVPYMQRVAETSNGRRP